MSYMPLAVFQDFCQQSAFFASRGVWKLYAHHHFYSKKRHRRSIDMPTIRRVAALGCYFIGNPASSFSANVVMIRRALGAAPTSTNLRVMDFPRPGSFNEQFA